MIHTLSNISDVCATAYFSLLMYLKKRITVFQESSLHVRKLVDAWCSFQVLPFIIWNISTLFPHLSFSWVLIINDQSLILLLSLYALIMMNDTIHFTSLMSFFFGSKFLFEGWIHVTPDHIFFQILETLQLSFFFQNTPSCYSFYCPLLKSFELVWNYYLKLPILIYLYLYESFLIL